MSINIEPPTADELSDQCFEDMIKANTDPDIMCENAFNTMVEEFEEEKVRIDGPHERNI